MTEEIIEKWLIYKMVKQKPKTQSWDVLSRCNNSRLGIIEWYPPWRHYCFFPEKLTVFSDRCLQSIKDFVTKLNEDHKQKKGRCFHCGKPWESGVVCPECYKKIPTQGSCGNVGCG